MMGTLACASRSAPSTPPEPPPTHAVAPLSVALMGGSDGSIASGASIDRLLAAPEVTAAGQRLLQRLGDDPALEPHYSSLLVDLLQQPAMTEAIAGMAARSPGASMEALTDQVVSRLTEGLEGPHFDAALDAALDRLLARPSVDAAFDRMASAMIERARISERLAALLLDWQTELEAAVGLPMRDEAFADRLAAHVREPERSRQLEELLGVRLAEDLQIREALAALLDDDAFAAACAHLLERVLTSSGFMANATAVLAGMVERVDAAELAARVDRVLVTPPIERAVVAWADEIIAARALTTFAQRIGAMLDDPNLQAELFDVLVGAAAGPTA